MKAERRHELKENDLTHAIEVGRAYLQGHGKSLGLLVLAVIAVVVVIALVARNREAQAEDQWDKMSRLDFATPEASKRSLDRLGELAAASQDDHFALSALISKGRRALEFATSGDTLPDKEMNDTARDAFDSILKRFPQNAVAVGTANLGLATVEENDFTLDGDIAHKDKARAYLKTVLDDSRLHTMPFYQTALERSEALDETFTKVAFKPAPPKPEGEGERIRVGPMAPTPGTSKGPIKVEPGSPLILDGATLDLTKLDRPGGTNDAGTDDASTIEDAPAPDNAQGDREEAESKPAAEGTPEPGGKAGTDGQP